MLLVRNQKLLTGVAIIYAIFMSILSGILVWFYWQGMDVAVIDDLASLRFVLNLFFHPFFDALLLIWGIVSCIITCLNGKNHGSSMQ